MQNRLTALLCTLLIAACSSIEDSTGNNPIIDSQGVNLAHYEADLAECGAYADKVSIAQKASAGAVSGAAAGAVLGAIVGNSDTAKKGAGIGAAGGIVRGVDAGIRERERVIKRCLIGRGYRVLN